ncbi:MAG: hypothetical protein LBM67_08060 [Lentimicrobiaceae bacterium]|jgi:hypothetical protein|nr:hypothetical protein [Lentimicrobiaceae bacterium]
MKKNCFVILFLIAALFSCENKNKEKTKTFSNYLTSVFSLAIPKESHYFLLLPEYVCIGCVINSQIAINNYLDVHPDLEKKITFIYLNKEMANETLISRSKSFYDEQRRMNDDIPAALFGIGNLTVVATNKEKVVQVTSIDVDDLMQINKTLDTVFSSKNTE